MSIGRMRVLLAALALGGTACPEAGEAPRVEEDQQSVAVVGGAGDMARGELRMRITVGGPAQIAEPAGAGGRPLRVTYGPKGD